MNNVAIDDAAIDVIDVKAHTNRLLLNAIVHTSDTNVTMIAIIAIVFARSGDVVMYICCVMKIKNVDVVDV